MDSTIIKPKDWYFSKIDIKNFGPPHTLTQTRRLLGFLDFMGVAEPRKAFKNIKRFSREKSASCFGLFYKDPKSGVHYPDWFMGLALRTPEAVPMVDILVPPACVMPRHDQKEGWKFEKQDEQERERFLCVLMTHALSVPDGPLAKAHLRLIGDKEVIEGAIPACHKKIKMRNLFGIPSVGVEYDLGKYQDEQMKEFQKEQKKKASKRVHGVRLPDGARAAQPDLFPAQEVAA